MASNHDKLFEDFKSIALEYELTNHDIKYIWKIVEPIYCHKEFQKRCKPPYYHHQDLMLGTHILSDTFITYKLAKVEGIDKNSLRRAILISMFHDLYTLPWMEPIKHKYIVNYHAFTHPIEAIVNAICWYPDYFKKLEDSRIIIDGVLHHMFPCPVRGYTKKELELNNKELFDKLDYRYKSIIETSLKPVLGTNFSLRKSFYPEGRLVSRADKAVSMGKDLKGVKVFKFIKHLFKSGFKPIDNNKKM